MSKRVVLYRDWTQAQTPLEELLLSVPITEHSKNRLNTVIN